MLQAAVNGLTSKLDSLSSTVPSIQEQLNRKAETMGNLVSTVEDTPKSTTKTSKALKGHADKVHEITAKKAEGD